MKLSSSSTISSCFQLTLLYYIFCEPICCIATKTIQVIQIMNKFCGTFTKLVGSCYICIKEYEFTIFDFGFGRLLILIRLPPTALHNKLGPLHVKDLCITIYVDAARPAEKCSSISFHFNKWVLALLTVVQPNWQTWKITTF